MFKENPVGVKGEQRINEARLGAALWISNNDFDKVTCVHVIGRGVFLLRLFAN